MALLLFLSVLKRQTNKPQNKQKITTNLLAGTMDIVFELGSKKMSIMAWKVMFFTSARNYADWVHHPIKWLDQFLEFYSVLGFYHRWDFQLYLRAAYKQLPCILSRGQLTNKATTSYFSKSYLLANNEETSAQTVLPLQIYLCMMVGCVAG